MDNTRLPKDSTPNPGENVGFNTSSTLKLTEYDVSQYYKNNNEGHKSDTEAYIPSNYRDKSNATQDWGAFLHLLKSSLGSGILAMPGAFKNAGLISGIIGTIVVGTICTHCVHLLVYCSQLLCVRLKQPSLGFAETAELAFLSGPKKYRKWAPWSRKFVRGSLFAAHYLGNTVYVILIAESFQQVLEYFFEVRLNIRVYILALAVPLVPLGIIRSLKVLVPFSALATAFILFSLATTLYFTFIDLPPLHTRPFITPVQQWPLFFSTVLFAMEGIGTVLPIENSMSTPQHFLGCPGVLNMAMGIVISLYGSVGFFGFLKFGNEVQGSVTLNLGVTPLAETVKILVALSILFTYGLQFTVPSEIMWLTIRHKFSAHSQTKAFYIMKGLMIFGTILLATAVPQLNPCISLVGAVCLSILGLFCPAVIEIFTIYEDGYGFMKWRLVKNIIIIILSIFFLFSGSYASILDIIASYS